MTSDNDLLEKELQKQVTDIAEIYGWEWVHFRHARTNRGWRVPVEGPLGKGWPDLVLVKPGCPIIFVELKREKANLGVEQREVLTKFELAGALAYVWRPSDITNGTVQRALSSIQVDR